MKWLRALAWAVTIVVALYVGSLLVLRVGGEDAPVYANGITCRTFQTQRAAQDYYENDRSGRRALDGDADGFACESLP